MSSGYIYCSDNAVSLLLSLPSCGQMDGGSCGGFDRKNERQTSVRAGGESRERGEAGEDCLSEW